MSFSFHPEAETEFLAASDWYEERSTGLGLDLAAEVREAIGRAQSIPMAWQIVVPGIRRVLVHRFPYGVLYAHENGHVHVLAVMHLSRRPGYWLSRRKM
jgi:plasmid stabilization system protein ParE